MADVRQQEQPDTGRPSGGDSRFSETRLRGNSRLGETRPLGPVLRRADQAVVAGLVLCALVSMAVYWVVQGGPRGELIEIDRAEPLTARYLVDINTAEWPELAELPEIGETLARRIVESRLKDGAYKDHSDLKRVQGIGPRTLEKMRPYLLPMPEQADVAGGANVDANAL